MNAALLRKIQQNSDAEDRVAAAGFEQARADACRMILKMDPTCLIGDIRNDAEFLALAIDQCLKNRAAEVSNALKQCQETAKGMQNGGPSDWKANINNPDDLQEVIEVGKHSLDTVDGVLLGKKLEMYRQDRRCILLCFSERRGFCCCCC